jgi:hypothetical protein
MKRCVIAIALLAGSALAAPCLAQSTMWPFKPDTQAATERFEARTPRTDWQAVKPETVEGTMKYGEATHSVTFRCVTAAGGWWPSRWNGYKVFEMNVYFDPTPPFWLATGGLTAFPGLSPTNTDQTVKIVTSNGSFKIAQDEFAGSDVRAARDSRVPSLLTGYHSANIVVSDRVMAVLQREPKLQVKFGNSLSDDFSFAIDLDSGRQKILDLGRRCK